MRFGIMAMQLSYLVPVQASPESILAHIAGFDHADLVRSLAGSGFKHIELGGDLVLFLPYTYSPQSIDRLAALKSELGLTYTVHLPLWSVEPSSPLHPVRQGSTQALIDTIQATQPLQPEAYILHATGALAAEFYRMRLPEQARALILRQFLSAAHSSVQAILKQTGIPSRRLAIETVEFPFDLTLELAEDLDLSICLDTGHVLVGFSGPIGLHEATERCLLRLGAVHLHDGPWQGEDRVISYGKDHQPLGRGDLDVGRFLDQLSSAGYRGPIVFELAVEEALASLEYIRSIRPEFLAESR